jgi:hypothetical protein
MHGREARRVLRVRSGAICLASGTCGCAADADCGARDSGRVCDVTSGVCALGCRDSGGNGCPSGLQCIAAGAAPGTCVAPAPADDGQVAGFAAITDDGRVGGGGCAVPGGGRASGGSVLALLAAWAAASLGSRRRGARGGGRGGPAR